MPRVFFTGRKKISQDEVSIVFRPGRPPEFSATINLAKHRHTLPPDAKVVIEAYHNTMLQRFDFGTVADSRPRDPLRLSGFDEWDRPRFRLRVVDTTNDFGAVLASCERIDAVDPEQAATGGRSLLKLFPRPDSQMRGELWRLETIGGGYQLCYNKDVPWLERGIKARQPEVLGLILPAAIREILAREMLWEEIRTEETTEWISFAQLLIGEPPPSSSPPETTSIEDIESWIDGVIAAFCRNRGRFVERIREMEAAG